MNKTEYKWYKGKGVQRSKERRMNVWKKKNIYSAKWLVNTKRYLSKKKKKTGQRNLSSKYLETLQCRLAWIE